MPSSLGRFIILPLIAGSFFARGSDARAESQGSVLFVAPAVGELPDALRDALSAQLSGGESTLLFDRFSSEASTLRRQVIEARRLAAAHHAAGVFWLDAPADKDWLLYLAEPTGDRILVRRVTVEKNGTAAATEAVAVITSESSRALAHGETIGMQPVPLPPEPVPSPSTLSSPSPAQPEPPKHVVPAAPSPGARPFAGLGYYGDGPAEEIRWQSGARLSVGVRFPSGLYLNGGYLSFQQATVKGSQLSFQVSRTPLDLGLGFAFGRNRLTWALELRGVLDILSRQVISTGSSLQPTPDRTRVMIFVSPRSRVDLAISSAFGVYVAGGLDFALNSFSFVIDRVEHPLLRLAPVRPAFEVGASFTL